MIRLFITLFLTGLPWIAWGQSKLPPCLNKGQFGKGHCFGVLQFPDGSKYVGEILEGLRHGEGIVYTKSEEIFVSGVWRKDNLLHQFPLEKKHFPPTTRSIDPAPELPAIQPPEQLVRSSLALPTCIVNKPRIDCFDTVHLGQLTGTYVGQFKDDYRHGLGVQYSSDGKSVSFSGYWERDTLVKSYLLADKRFQFEPLAVAPTNAERDRLAAEVETERKKRQELETQLVEAKEREKQLAEAKELERQQAQAPQPQRPQSVLRNERRLALIIGNSSYKVSPLDNPANDATDIAESLKKFGFQTTLVRNATLGQMREATRRFADQLPSADVALIYFAGHGIESNRKNFMIPVNADLKFEYELADQGYDAGIWLEMLESIKSNNADRVNIVILDACRNNSLIGSRNLGRGLGKMDAPSGTFLAYSTAPGKVAADGGRGERNSPFTKHLLRAMQQPNQPIEEVFKEVRRNVGKETNGAQVPWESTSLTGFFAFRQMR